MGRGKVCQNKTLRCGMRYTATPHQPSPAIHGELPLGVCSFPESQVGVSKEFSTEQLALHRLSSSLKKALHLHLCFWNPFGSKALPPLTAVSTASVLFLPASLSSSTCVCLGSSHTSIVCNILPVSITEQTKNLLAPLSAWGTYFTFHRGES